MTMTAQRGVLARRLRSPQLWAGRFAAAAIAGAAFVAVLLALPALADVSLGPFVLVAFVSPPVALVVFHVLMPGRGAEKWGLVAGIIAASAVAVAISGPLPGDLDTPGARVAVGITTAMLQAAAVYAAAILVHVPGVLGIARRR